MTYHVVLLVEQPLTELDARQVTSLHVELGEEVIYDVLLPVDDAAERMATAVGTLGSGDLVGSPSYALASIDFEDLHEQSEVEAHEGLAQTLAQLRATGAKAQGAIVADDPIGALLSTVSTVDASEVIVLTSSHAVAEFFGVDWTSRARRHLDVPVLHLLEHETFAEQADGAGEGVTGL